MTIASIRRDTGQVIYLSLGSNTGDRLENLRRALRCVEQRCLTHVKTSIVLETKAILPPDAPQEWDRPYLNMIVCGESSLSPKQLLASLQQIELEMGREKDHLHWSPRTIDIDILLYNDLCLATDSLQVPHLELLNRPFFLHLLALLNPLLKHPGNHLPFELLAQQAADTDVFIRSLCLAPKFVGVVNVTPDSFSDGGEHDSTQAALTHAERLLDEGASVIEFGAQSTRPGSQQMGAAYELQRLEPILDLWYAHPKLKSIPVSIDTYWLEVMIKLVENYPIAWINDVKCQLDKGTLKIIANAGCSICVMHSLSVPPQRDLHLPLEDLPMAHIEQWFAPLLEKLQACGFERSSIIFDPGLGFGKTMFQNWALLRQIERMKQWGCPILIGHSRKSFYNAVCKENFAQRDVETLAVSSCLQPFNVDYLRVHNVQMHQRFFSTQHCLNSYYAN